MAIVKMRFVNLMGRVDDFDRAVEQYVASYDIQLENCLSELREVKGLSPFEETFSYQAELAQASSFLESIGMEKSALPAEKSALTADEAAQSVHTLERSMQELREKQTELNAKLDAAKTLVTQIEPMIGLDMDLAKLLHFEYIRFRFGRLPRESASKLEVYIDDELNLVFLPTKSDGDFLYGIYFVPHQMAVKVDTIMKSLHFEWLRIPDGLEGTPYEAMERAKNAVVGIESELEQLGRELKGYLEVHTAEVVSAYTALAAAANASAVKKYAARTDKQYFIIAGWMPEAEVKRLQKSVADDEDVIFVICDENAHVASTPPVQLKNNRVFRPFEMFVKMYGLPNYREIDPTPFVAITYSILFGMMFGDLGQGALLMILGLLAYRFMRMPLGGILACAGACSMFFGCMYGSFFGFEDLPWLQPIWLSPMHETMTILITTVVIGMGLIVVAMIFHLINAWKQKDLAGLLFGTNGAAGLLFYLTALVTAGGMVTGLFNVPMAIAAVVLLLALIGIGIYEPMANFFAHKRSLISTSRGMFLMETFFELFEVLLSYITNSISFIRVGAFALSHAGMMSVVFLLREGASGAGNVLSLILGNLLVMGLEGLIVGIQVLRLEFYEMFSRFFSGTGRAFQPYHKEH